MHLEVGKCVSPVYPCQGYRICRPNKDEYVVSNGEEEVAIREDGWLKARLLMYGVMFCGATWDNKCVLVATNCKLHAGPYADPLTGRSGSGEAIIFDGARPLKTSNAVIITPVRTPTPSVTFLALANTDKGAVALVSELREGALAAPVNGRIDLDKFRGVSIANIVVPTLDNVLVRVSLPKEDKRLRIVYPEEYAVSLTGWLAELHIAKGYRVRVKVRHGTVSTSINRILERTAVPVGYPVSSLPEPRLTLGWLLPSYGEQRSEQLLLPSPRRAVRTAVRCEGQRNRYLSQRDSCHRPMATLGMLHRSPLRA